MTPPNIPKGRKGPVIPKGWRILHKGTVIRKGDKWLLDPPADWQLTTMEGDRVNLALYIRRTSRRREK